MEAHSATVSASIQPFNLSLGTAPAPTEVVLPCYARLEEAKKRLREEAPIPKASVPRRKRPGFAPPTREEMLALNALRDPQL